MDRRTFLSGLGAAVTALAGCSGRQTKTRTLTPAPVGNESTPTPTETPDDVEQSVGGLGEASIVRLETGPRTLALAPPSAPAPDGAQVEVRFTATATPDHPARLRAALTNTNDWQNTFRLGDIPPFKQVTTARLRDLEGDRETTLYLAPTANHDLVDESPTYERGPEGYWRATDVPPELPPTVRLGPGEQVTGEYFLLGYWERRGFPTGQYSFEWDDHGFTIAAWNSDSPGPEAQSKFAGRSVPDLPQSTTAWYHEADAATTVYLEPSRERVDAPGTVTFTFVNHATEPATGNPYDWTLYKLVDGEWARIAPWGIPVPLSAVAPGQTHTDTLRAFHGDAVPCEEGHSVGHLGGGTYAYRVGFSRKDGATHAALFELDARALTPTPPEAASVARDGDTVTVTTGAWRDGEHPPSATLTVEPVGDDWTPGPERDVLTVIPEQLYRRPHRALRHALPRFDAELDRVVLRTDEHRASAAIGRDSQVRYIRYEEQIYRAQLRRIETATPTP